jgi:hypothetical protein
MHGESSHQAGTVVDPFAFILSPGFSMCLRAGSGLPRGLSSPLDRPFLSLPQPQIAPQATSASISRRSWLIRPIARASPVSVGPSSYS